MGFNSKFGTEDVSPYQVHSRREITLLLRAMLERKQLVSMQSDGGTEAIVTSILAIDEETGTVIIDRAPSNIINQRIIDSDSVSFETLLDNIRIMFFSSQVQECQFENLPALQFPIPPSLVRLQRREHYRIATPVTTPVRCTITIPPDDAAHGASTTVVVTIKDISCGGIAIVDDRKVLDSTIGRVYSNCRVDLPSGTALQIQIQVRNSADLTLASGKSIRKLGCMFVDLPRPALSIVQRYITRLERERNAKATGML